MKTKQQTKEKLRKIAEKWKKKSEKISQMQGRIYAKTLSSLNWNYQGKESDSPLLCSHDHCRFWQRKTVVHQLRKEKTELQKKLEETEEELNAGG